MKRLLSVIIVLVFLFCSCAVQPEEIKINRCFTAKAQIQYQSTAFTADFTSDESGCSAVFSLPQEISGLKIEYNGTGYTYILGELSFNSGIKKENEQFLKIFFEALRDPDMTITENETGYTATGTVAAGTYYININNTHFTPVFFEVEEIGLSISFV